MIYQRLIGLRGPIRQLQSDHGTNFVGAKRELEQALQEMDWDAVSVSGFLHSQQCDLVTFKMNPPSASHMEGVWECQIRTTRSILSTLMEQNGHQLENEGLRMLLLPVMIATISV